MVKVGLNGSRSMFGIELTGGRRLPWALACCCFPVPVVAPPGRLSVPGACGAAVPVHMSSDCADMLGRCRSAGVARVHVSIGCRELVPGVGVGAVVPGLVSGLGCRAGCGTTTGWYRAGRIRAIIPMSGMSGIESFKIIPMRTSKSFKTNLNGL